MIDTQISVVGAALSPVNIRVEFLNTFVIVNDEKFDYTNIIQESLKL